MCGIAGIVSLDGRPLVNPNAALRQMLELLQHRGPDQDGIYVSDDGLTALGNTRLSIVGVDEKPVLPMTDASREAVITFNGEIYNHAPLRNALRYSGRSFRTHTDTEVLLNGLLDQGTEFLEKCDGVWAFALLFRHTRRIVLCRDLMGEKPLYYTTFNKRLFFSSEVAPLIAVLPSEAVSFDRDAVITAFQYRAAPPSQTIMRGIRRLGAGEMLTVIAGLPDISLSRALRLKPEQQIEFFLGNPSQEKVLERYAELISEACSVRVPSEVDYIATLSGGIDSTLINCFLAKSLPDGHDTLFGKSGAQSPKLGSDLSEQDAAAHSARRLGTRHHVLSMLTDTSVQIYKDSAADSFDGVFCEGSADFGILAEYVKSQKKRVIILSDGPDELLTGYRVDVQTLADFQRMSRSRHGPALTTAIFSAARRGCSISGRLLNWAYVAGAPFAVRPNHGGSLPLDMAAVFGHDAFDVSFKKFGQVQSDYDHLANSLDVSQQMSLGYACTSLPDYVNTRSDRGTMRQSVEARLPFQSKKVVELMLATPKSWRVGNGTSSKHILRLMVDRMIGKQIASRAKYGFAQPLWSMPGMRKRLGFEDAIGGSPIFKELGFLAGSRDYLLRPTMGRFAWMAFSLALTYERLHRAQRTQKMPFIV